VVGAVRDRRAEAHAWPSPGAASLVSVPTPGRRQPDAHGQVVGVRRDPGAHRLQQDVARWWPVAHPRSACLSDGGVSAVSAERPL